MSKTALRITAWAVWQSVVMLFAFLAWANLFSEYGVYDKPVVGFVTAVLLLALAVSVGTWLPVRRWRRD